ncbi:FabG-like short-chain dehydrogenase/reductase [Ligilactobacillus salitolerans]|uniref:FabG-like short-chain dehydrogenase/reductase n=1 Tax=Ligilactobacillus salitolerans TaxID=1808352 RepID=A0A401IWI7_9LACO|nr:SDR family oxidoreductase [Ligilactobacillus salitolerans]GBG95867.1 FabG-like short-chain dehydrogenase/reductase [Ligilactobacillus salitolerans]
MAKETAIITGGASGIGLAIAQELMSQGIQVVACDLNEEALNKLCQANELYDGKKVDVTDEEQVKDFVDYVVSKHGRIDRSFHVAGASKPGLIIEQPLEDWNFTVNLVLNGVFLFTKYVGQQMKKQKGGKIVNISSLNAHVPMFFGAAYSSAKAGVEMLTKNAALELADYGINVNVILPGLVNTPLTAGLTGDETINGRFKERIPAKRGGDPKEIAQPAVFLSSEGASYINGTSLVVDGGWEVTGYPDLRV